MDFKIFNVRFFCAAARLRSGDSSVSRIRISPTNLVRCLSQLLGTEFSDLIWWLLVTVMVNCLNCYAPIVNVEGN